VTTFLIPGGSRPRSGSAQRLEGGFTILELLVVVAILAVVMAVAIPSFLYARSRTQEHAAQAGQFATQRTL